MYCICNQAYFMGLIFAVRQSSAKITKIGPLENFPLYGIMLPSPDHYAHIMLMYCTCKLTFDLVMWSTS